VYKFVIFQSKDGKTYHRIGGNNYEGNMIQLVDNGMVHEVEVYVDSLLLVASEEPTS